tara:strand:+ start:2336 stop:6865 length:4530 start_codon:yes stop_codon:yes gene_type:complete
MSKSYRIRTTPGEDNGYLKVNVDLSQNYDHLEILSLKISQIDEYQSYCSDYGVIAGRVIINNGFGVPNTRVSIFVPVENVDLEDPIISALYPYEDPFPDKKNVSGLRYNVLPNNKRSLDHTPVGSFPKKREVLDDSTTLEIYEKYYKYTTTTNESGDYILFGVPVGEHYLHYDLDVSDMGFISSRPYEMIAQGYSDDLFDSKFKFKTSNNIDTLPQIFSQNIPINVEPFWCDSLSVGSPLGINRQDISIPYEVTPTAIFIGSIFTDDEKDSLNKNCKPNREMGKMNEVITGAGKIEAIRRNGDGGIEEFNFNDNSIDENGNWSVLVPMNIRKVVTDEFGNLVPSPDGIKGIASEGDYRFRISMDATSNDKRLRQRAKFLVPNINNNFSFGEYSQVDLQNSTDFTINEQLSTITDNTPYADDLSNEYNYLEEFYSFRWKKVYTVKQYIGRYQKTSNDEARGFIGIKDILNSEGINKFPSNRMDNNTNILYGIICLLLSIFGVLVGIINSIIMILNGLITLICQLRIPVGLCINSNKKSRYKLEFNRQERILGVWTGSPIISNFNKGYTSPYDPTSDFTGTNGNQIPGNFDGGLGNCNDCRYWYPSQPSNGITSGPIVDTPQKPGGGDYDLMSNDTPSRWDEYVYSNGISKDEWVYESGCNSGGPNGCRRYKLNKTGSWRESIVSCNKVSTNEPCDDGVSFLGLCIKLKFKCLLAGLMCKKCQASCPNEDGHSCCPESNHDWGCPDNSPTCTGSQCCCDCCVKIPLIPLKCKDEGEWKITTGIPTPFAATKCNRNYVAPVGCINCGGLQTAGVKDWVACVLEGLAVWLKMLKFDFYNDWVGGSLYFPLIKRKYKLKKSKRKFGQIKKDKFCDFECRIRNANPPEFQGEPTYTQWRIKLPNYGINPTIEFEGCSVELRGKRVTDWYGTPEDDTEATNLDLAIQDFSFNGTKDNGDGCVIKYASFDDFETMFNNLGINFSKQDRETFTGHGKPEYIQVDDGNGNTSWENIGGHGHYRNVCNNVKLVERKEYFKTELDCTGDLSKAEIAELGDEDGFGDIPPPDVEEPTEETEGCGFASIQPQCDNLSCLETCGSNGVAPCKDTNTTDTRNYNIPVIEHGLITWHDQVIYYTPRILPEGDSQFNQNEYKANLLLPTTIMEIGSSVYCDIDDVPFIIDQLEPTTFNVSYEDTKYKSKFINNTYTQDGETGQLREFTKFEDKKDSSLNLRAYAEFGCFSVVCSNTLATVNQSQIGVEMIDKNDIGVEIGNCFVRFDHDEDLRSYFCRRFNGFKGNSTFHHMRPGSNQFENDYQTYSEITLSDGFNLFYRFPTDEGGETIKSEYNDDDPFIPGDACGYNDTTNNVDPDYFYGLAPGQTSNFVNYPNVASLPLNFGASAHANNIDILFTGTTATEDLVLDTINGASNIRGIRFNRSQTPYYMYFGLVPGKTALHKTVGKFFADKISAVTLQGVGATNDDVSQNINNQPNLFNPEKNAYTIYKTCLGETLIDVTTSGTT